MTILLITGSRDTTLEMLHYAYRVVDRVAALDWHIVVGDAEGVDTAVIDACKHYNVPFACYGIRPYPRYTGHVPVYERINGDYLARDRAMVDKSDCCIGIWNGSSRGTKYTYDYAVKRGKQAWLKTFERVKP